MAKRESVAQFESQNKSPNNASLFCCRWNLVDFHFHSQQKEKCFLFSIRHLSLWEHFSQTPWYERGWKSILWTSMVIFSVRERDKKHSRPESISLDKHQEEQQLPFFIYFFRPLLLEGNGLWGILFPESEDGCWCILFPWLQFISQESSNKRVLLNEGW